MFQRQVFAAALLAALGRLEEKPVLDGCTMIDRDLRWDVTANANAICDGGFKTMVHTNISDTLGGGNKEIVVGFTQPHQIKTAFVQNRCSANQAQKRMGKSAIYVGEDTGASLSPGMVQCSDDVFDSGFYPMTCTTKGKNAAIRRSGPAVNNDLPYNIQEMRFYQTPNLLELPKVTISAPAPIAPQWAATNLITHFNRRTAGNNLKPQIDQAGNSATWESCFKTGAAQLSVHGHKLVLQVDLGDVYFQHAVLTVQDLFYGWLATHMNDPLKYFQNFEIYIGNSPNWAENPKCKDGPFMRPEDPKSYVKVTASGYQAPPEGMWKFGHEAWCNMEGRYLTIVADLSSQAGKTSTLAPNGYEMSLCHLGLFGALYKRTTPVPSSLEVLIGSPATLDVEKITADATTPITNTLDITLRQKAGTELSWITFTQDSLVTKVKFAPDASVAPGDYTVVLESFDQGGGVYSALKTDTIAVKVLPSECGQALAQTKTFQSTEPIVLTKEYLPTVFFPETLFSGPHTFAGASCGGTYTQTIAMDAPTTGVVITDQPTGPDKRPRVSIDDTAAADSTFTLTFSGRYEYTPTNTDLTSSYRQTYKLRTVFAPDLIEQPTITHFSAAADLAFTVPPAAPGTTPPMESLTAGSFAVAYPIKSGTTDALGNTPPAIVPLPFSGFDANHFTKGQLSLGTASLTSPPGVLNIQGTGFTGNLSTGTFSFRCDTWTMANQGRTIAKTLSFANSVNASFKATIDVSCSYQPFKPPKFASELTRVELTASVASAWTLPSVIEGTFALKQIRFEPDPVLAGALSFDADTRVVKYDGSSSVVDSLGALRKCKIVLVDVHGNEASYEHTVNLVRCPVTSDQVQTLAGTLATDTVKLSVQAGKVGQAQVTYRDKYDKIIEKLAFTDLKQTLCGAVSIDLVTQHASLKQQREGYVLFLTADATSEAAVYEDAFLNVRVSSFSLKIPIRAEFTSCAVTRLSFEKQILKLEYEVGSGDKTVTLPQVIQRPDCGYPFEHMRLKEIESKVVPMQQVQKAVTIELATKALIIATEDLSFVGQNATLTISVEADSVESKTDLSVLIEFTGSQKPEPPLSSSDHVSLAVGVDLGIPGLKVPQVTKQQADLLKTPVAKLSVEQQFAAMPLAARLSNGIDYVIELVEAQRRHLDWNRAATKEAQQADALIVKMGNSGSLQMRFTKQINFPDDILQTVQTNGRRSLQANETTPRIEIFAVRRTDLYETTNTDPLINSWELRVLNERDLEVFVNFTDPLEVSADEPDLLVVQLELSGYFDGNGKSLPESLVKYVQVPRQMASQAEAETVAKVGSAAASTAKVGLASSFIVNILVAGSLYQVWSLINTLQVVQLIRLFAVKTPGNVNSFTDFFTEITSIKELDEFVKGLSSDKISLPEDDPFSLNFQNAGFESPFFVANSRTPIFLFLVQLCLPAILLALRILECCCACLGCLRKRVQAFIFWNGTSRLMMETYCDVILFAMLNLYEVKWSDGRLSVARNNQVALTFFIVYLLLPAVLLACAYREAVRHDLEFNRSYGALLEGSTRKKEKRRAAIFLPISFFTKRLVLCFSLVFWQDFCWGQIALQLAYTTGVIIFLQAAEPMETRFKRRLETFNEFLTFTVLYFLMYFSDFNPQPALRHTLGFAYIADVSLFAAVHLCFIAVGTLRSFYLILKRIYNRYLRPKPRIVKKEPIKKEDLMQLEEPSDLERLRSDSQAVSSSLSESSNQIGSSVSASEADLNDETPVEQRRQPLEEEKDDSYREWVNQTLKRRSFFVVHTHEAPAVPSQTGNFSQTQVDPYQGIVLSPMLSPRSMTLEEIEERVERICNGTDLEERPRANGKTKEQI